MADDRKETDANIQDFVLARDLAEVYLLMDHISANQDKELPTSIDKKPFDKESKETWLEQICRIAWPPEDSTPAEDAINAAKLIRAKDMLNKAAAPATGGSIAFTIMVAGEARDPQDPQKGNWWRRTLRRIAEGSPSDPAPPSGGRGNSRLGWSGAQPPSRASLAALAYPALSRSAPRYRRLLYALLFFLVAWLVVTCMVSWDVATGNSLLNRVAVLNTQVMTLQNAAATSTSSTQPPAGGTGARGQGPAGGQRSSSGATQTDKVPTSSEDLPRALELRAAATDNLLKWMDGRGLIRTFLLGRMGGSQQTGIANLPVGRSNDPAASLSSPGEVNAEWAQVLLGVLASTILPVFYGLLGAGASVVRTVAGRMRDSLLAPRDILLAYVQLALGAVIGACIGLFVTSDGSAAATQGALLGSVPLSASALCFVAGFGVEGVFQALESLTRRVFNTDARPAT